MSTNEDAPSATATASPVREQGADAGIWNTLRESPRAVKALMLGVFINRLGTLLQIYLVLFLTNRGFSPVQAGIALGCFGLGAVLGNLVGGELADQLGVRRAILLSMVGTAVFVLGVYYVHHYPSVLVCVAMVSMVSQVYRPASSAMLAELTPPHRRVMIFAINRLALNLGATAAPLLGVALISISYGALFWVQVVGEVGYALIVMATLPRDRERGQRASAAAQPAAATGGPEPAGADGASQPGVPARQRSGYAAVLADRPFVLYLAAFMINSIVYLQYASVLPLAMQQAGLAVIWYSAMVSLNGFIVITCELLATKVVQRWPMRVASTAGFALLGSGLAIYMLPGGATIFVIGTLVWTLAEIVAGPTMFAYAATAAPDHLRGRYIGIAQAVFGIGVAIGPVVGLMVWRVAGDGVWLFYALVCVLGMAAAWIGMAPKGAQLVGPAGVARASSSPVAIAYSAIAATLRRAVNGRRARVETGGTATVGTATVGTATVGTATVDLAPDGVATPVPVPATDAQPVPAELATPALTVTLTLVEDTWTLTATRQGAVLVEAPGLPAATAFAMVTSLNSAQLHAALEEILAEQRARALERAQRLRAELVDIEAQTADIAGREAELAKLRGAATLATMGPVVEPTELADSPSR